MIAALLPLVLSILLIIFIGVFLNIVLVFSYKDIPYLFGVLINQFKFSQPKGIPILFVSAETMSPISFLKATVLEGGKRKTAVTDDTGLVFVNRKGDIVIEIEDNEHLKQSIKIEKDSKGNVIVVKKKNKGREKGFRRTAREFVRDYITEMAWMLRILISIQLFAGFLSAFIAFAEDRVIYLVLIMLLYGIGLLYMGSLNFHWMFQSKGLLLTSSDLEPVSGALVVYHRDNFKRATYTNNKGIFKTSVDPGEYDLFVNDSSAGQLIKNVSVNSQGFVDSILKIGDQEDEKRKEGDNKDN
jgi:hypothetical protein